MDLSLPIEELDMSVRTYNVVKRHGVHTFGDLVAVTVQDANSWADTPTHGGTPHTITPRMFEELANYQRYIRGEQDWY